MNYQNNTITDYNNSVFSLASKLARRIVLFGKEVSSCDLKTLSTLPLLNSIQYYSPPLTQELTDCLYNKFGLHSPDLSTTVIPSAPSSEIYVTSTYCTGFNFVAKVIVPFSSIDVTWTVNTWNGSAWVSFTTVTQTGGNNYIEIPIASAGAYLLQIVSTSIAQALPLINATTCSPGAESIVLEGSSPLCPAGTLNIAVTSWANVNPANNHWLFESSPDNTTWSTLYDFGANSIVTQSGGPAGFDGVTNLIPFQGLTLHLRIRDTSTGYISNSLFITYATC